MRRATTSGVVVAAAVAAWSAALAAQTTKPAATPARYGLGRAATPDEIRKLDIDVRPDGTGLPDGRGTATQGAAIYAAKCASCHGKSGEGASFDRLVATDAGDNFAFGRDPRLARAIGNYWPYASTLYDYTMRTMPFTAPGTLTPDEGYALVAYLLALNKVVPDDAAMDRISLPKVVMPAQNRFVRDNRAGGKVVK